MSSAKTKKEYVITYKELALLFIAFSVVLFVLYPKKLLLTQIMAQQSNYDLGITYLKNMLRNDPHNETLLFDLATLQLKSGKDSAALHLLAKLQKSKNPAIRKRAYLLAYKATKQEYFAPKRSQETREKSMQNLQKLFTTIVQKRFYDINALDTWYNEAVFLGQFHEAYLLLQQKLFLHPKDIQTAKNLLYMSQRFHLTSDTLRYLHLLQTIDVKSKEKWLMDEYYLLMKEKKYVSVEKLLHENAKHSIVWSNRLANFYLDRKKYQKASDVYMDLFGRFSAYGAKTREFKKAIGALRAGGYTKKASYLAYQHQAYFIHDKQMRIYLLKLYFAAGDLDKASHLSHKILQMKR